VGNQTFIEINGKKYDAISGRLVDSASHKASITSVKPATNQGSIDGFSRRSKKPQNHRTPAQHALKQTQKSQTLMRNSVKKPALTPPQVAKNEITRSSLGQHPRRVAHSQNTIKSPHVQKFSAPAARTSIRKESKELTVQTPKHHSIEHHEARNHQHAIQKSQHNSAAGKMIEAALANAQSHEQTHHHTSKKKKSRLTRKLGVSAKTLSMSSAVLAVVLLAGFFAVQNVPNLAMRVAATRAGFNASMPAYKPSGFSFKGPINYSSGRVTVSFVSNSDDRTYELTQRNSDWNTDALLANFVVEENKQYQTYVDKGRTLFIYDDSNATWVDNGIWYQIEGESDMTTDQLARIAASI
jgi:hypothetical protein